jgi:pimeloyl-ACP methyl ester carboxylesterase
MRAGARVSHTRRSATRSEERGDTCQTGRTSFSSTAPGPTGPAGAASSSASRKTDSRSERHSSHSARWLRTSPGSVRSSTSRTVQRALGPDATNVAGLVYIAAFALDDGESLGAILSQGPVTPALEHQFIDSRGFGWLSEDDFVHHFAADVDSVRARVLYAVQQAIPTAVFTDVMREPSWKICPSWYLVAQDDEAIPPDAQRHFATRMRATTVEVPSSHVAMVSHPEAVADLIEKAAAGVLAAA